MCSFPFWPNASSWYSFARDRYLRGRSVSAEAQLDLAAVQIIGRLGSFDDVVEREDFGVLEIPYPAWLAKKNEIRELIARGYTEDFKFALPLLRNYFSLCHALVSAREITITPFQPLVHLFPPSTNAAAECSCPRP